MCKRPHVAIAALALLPLLGSCGGGKLPSGVECEQVVSGGGSPIEALESASPGTCVLLRGGTYEGPFNVESGVKLVAAAGERVRLQADVEWDRPVVGMRGGEGTALIGVEVETSRSIGVWVVDGPAEVSGVRISGEPEVGLYLTCPNGDCGESRRVVVRDVEIEGGQVGLFARGTALRVEGGRIAEQSTTRATGGFGVIASEGALLDMEGSLIERSQEGGLLIDGFEGEGGTRASLDDLRVLDNQGRGVWAQGLRGSREDPALRISGARIEGNRMVGVGASETVGIIIVDGTLTRTLNETAPMRGGGSTTVGDGITLLGSSDVLIEGTELAGNERAQILLAGCGEGVEISNVDVSYDDGSYGIVVQDSVEPLMSDSEEDLDAPHLGAPADVPVSVDE